MFSALTAILALRDQGLAHARCVVLIEACEESGSYDLPHYVRSYRHPNRQARRWWCASIPVAEITTGSG